MDLGGKRFGTGPKELGGAIDLVNQFKLLHHHEFFCKRALPSSLSETHYLRNVVGDTEIRKGEGMELDQLFQTSSYVRQRDYSLCPSDLEVLGEAFRMRDLTPIDLPSVEKGIPTAVKPNSLSKDKEGQPRKHRVKYHGRNKHRHKYGISAENKKRGAHQYSVSEQLKNHLEKPPVYIAYISTVDRPTCADLLLVYSIAHFETALTALIVIVMASMSIQKRKHDGRGDLSVIHQNNGQITEKLLELLVLFLSLLLDYLVEVTILD
ncbi:hypothetical protein WN943_012207 [Citrus x changshan-huyou]